MKLRRLMQIAGPGTKATKRQRCASQQNWPANDAMGQKRTAARFGHVRYTPKSGQTRRRSVCPLSAMCGRLRVGKSFLHVRSIGRCSHVFGLEVRFT